MSSFPIDLDLLRSKPELYKDSFRKRGLDPSVVDLALELDRKRIELQKEIDNLRHGKNKISKEFASLKKEGIDIEKEKKLKEELEKIEGILKEKEKEYEGTINKLIEILLTFPNFVDERVPMGGEENNTPIRFWGVPRVWINHLEIFKEQTEKWGWKIIELKELLEKPEYSKYIIDKEKLKELYYSLKGEKEFIEISYNDVLNFELLNKDKIIPYVLIEWGPKHHYDLVKEFDLADTDIASQIAGSRFYIEKGIMVFLDFALSLYALEFYEQEGYKNVIIPPYLMKKDVEKRITYFESFKDTIYSVKEDDLILIPTSEHPIVAIYMDKIFNESELPLKILAWSPAFRVEAGAHGKDTKGIFRTHQFHKVELHIITTLDKDKEALEELREVFEKFIQKLNIPYRVVILASGDMDKRATIQYDIEAWFPAQGKYRELGSLAAMGDWVSRKLNIKVRRKGKTEFVANLYATGVAIQRTFCCIFENYYDPKRDVIVIPKVLQKYVRKEYISK